MKHHGNAKDHGASGGACILIVDTMDETQRFSWFEQNIGLDCLCQKIGRSSEDVVISSPPAGSAQAC